MDGWTYRLGDLATVDGDAADGADYAGTAIAPDRTRTALDVAVGSGGEWSFSLSLDQPGAWQWRVAPTDPALGPVEEGVIYCSPSETWDGGGS
jgi:hypothetical protein